MGFDFVLVNGFTVNNLSCEHKDTLNFLIQNSEQADEFVFGYLMNSRNENLAVINYRDDRILRQNIILDDFLILFKVKPITALSNLFLHPIKEQEFSILLNKINNDKISIEKLFQKHMQYPYAKFLRLILD